MTRLRRTEANMKKHWSNKLIELSACSEAVNWSRTQKSLAIAWQNCERGDWLLWLLAVKEADHRKIVLAACQCARLALRFVPPGEDRPLRAIEAAEKWAESPIGATEAAEAARAAEAAEAAALA